MKAIFGVIAVVMAIALAGCGSSKTLPQVVWSMWWARRQQHPGLFRKV